MAPLVSIFSTTRRKTLFPLIWTTLILNRPYGADLGE
jgi:hypothetical protein